MTRLFPVRPNSKKPWINNWPEMASADPQLQRYYFGPAFPGALIGLVLEGLACLDIDTPEAIEALWQEFGPETFSSIMATTYRESTPRGGVHWVARASPGLDRQWNNWRPGIDLKAGRGSYIIISPSTGYQRMYGLKSLNPADLQEWPAAVATALCDRRPASEMTSGRTSLSPQEEWDALVEATSHYRTPAQTLEFLQDDCIRLADAGCGEQEQLLTQIGYKWGRRVSQRFIGAQYLLVMLASAGMQMVNYDRHDPWTRPQIVSKLKRAILSAQ